MADAVGALPLSARRVVDSLCGWVRVSRTQRLTLARMGRHSDQMISPLGDTSPSDVNRARSSGSSITASTVYLQTRIFWAS